MPIDPAMIGALFAWLHLVATAIAAGLLLTEYWLCRRPPDRTQARLMGTVDLGYFLALIAGFATGLARMLYFGQDVAYYAANRLFWLKITIFVALALVAAGPSLQYVRWNREARSAPTFAPLTRDVERVRASIAFGLGLWLILPLLATLIARGYGLPDTHPWSTGSP
jgi:putative membrane protein